MGAIAPPFFCREQNMKNAVIALLILIFSPAAASEIASGKKLVLLESAGGESFELGSLDISRDGSQWRFSFSPNDAGFSDHFLSMRPFKCIDGESMYCHLVYPYDKPQTMTAEDFGNLEYEFLFIVRSPNEYGIDPYNGRYYVIRREKDMLVGEARAVDLNILAAPPEAGVTRPITETELDIIELESERFPRLIIR